MTFSRVPAFISQVLKTAVPQGRHFSGSATIYHDHSDVSEKEARVAKAARDRQQFGECAACGFELRGRCHHLVLDGVGSSASLHVCSHACIDERSNFFKRKGFRLFSVVCKSHGGPLLTATTIAQSRLLNCMRWLDEKSDEAERIGLTLDEYLHNCGLIQRPARVLQNTDELLEVAVAELKPGSLAAPMAYETALKIARQFNSVYPDFEGRIVVAEGYRQAACASELEKPPQNSFSRFWSEWMKQEDSPRGGARFFVVNGREHTGRFVSDD